MPIFSSLVKGAPAFERFVSAGLGETQFRHKTNDMREVTRVVVYPIEDIQHQLLAFLGQFVCGQFLAESFFCVILHGVLSFLVLPSGTLPPGSCFDIQAYTFLMCIRVTGVASLVETVGLPQGLRDGTASPCPVEWQRPGGESSAVRHAGGRNTNHTKRVLVRR